MPIVLAVFLSILSISFGIDIWLKTLSKFFVFNDLVVFIIPSYHKQNYNAIAIGVQMDKYERNQRTQFQTNNICLM